MGRIKTKLTKSLTFRLLEAHGDKFTTDFNKNKLIIGEVCDVESKKIRNTIAGYLTRLIKARGEN